MIGVSASLRKGGQQSWFVHGQLASYSLSRWPQSTTTPIGGGVLSLAEEVFFARDLNSQIAAKKQLGGDSSTGYPTRYSGDTKAGHRPRWGTRETRMLDTDRDAWGLTRNLIRTGLEGSVPVGGRGGWSRGEQHAMCKVQDMMTKRDRRRRQKITIPSSSATNKLPLFKI